MFSDSTLIIFDLETTDHAVADTVGMVPQIVELGAVKVTSQFEILDKIQFFVQPIALDSFTEFSESLTGITRKQLESAEPWKDLWRDFAKFTNYKAIRLVSWYTPSDWRVMREEYRIMELAFPHNPVMIDAMTLAYMKAAEQGLKVSCSLNSFCERLNIERTEKHRALPDALATLQVLKALYSFGDEESYGGVFAV